MTTTDQRLDRIEQLLLSVHHFINFWSSKMSQELTDLQATMQAIQAGAAVDRAAAVVSSAKADTAIGLLQALTAKIGELVAQGGGATAAELVALNVQGTAALADLNASKAIETAADTALDTAVAANTPGDPAPSPQDSPAPVPPT